MDFLLKRVTINFLNDHPAVFFLAMQCCVHDVLLTPHDESHTFVYHSGTIDRVSVNDMPPLTDLEIERLASDIQKTLLATRFACSSLMRITGGSTSYTFRGLLQMPLAVFDRKPTTTVIVKKATDHAAINTYFALDSSRSVSLVLSSTYTRREARKWANLLPDLRRRDAESPAIFETQCESRPRSGDCTEDHVLRSPSAGSGH